MREASNRGWSLAMACTVAFCVLVVLGFCIGTLTGLAWSSRSKVCAVIKQPNGVNVPVCDYDYNPPPGWEIS